MTETQAAYQICRRTVMDTSDPDIWFDESGQSSHAVRYDRNLSRVVANSMAGLRQPELDAIFHEIRESSRNKRHDSIVGLSGGVDSTYVALQAVRAGLRPLAVHFDSGWDSDSAKHNVRATAASLGLDLVTYTANRDEMYDLQLAYLKSGVLNLDMPTDHAFPYAVYHQAAQRGIKYLLTGFNYASESIMPSKWSFAPKDIRNLKAIHSQHGSVPLRTFPRMGYTRTHLWYRGALGIRAIDVLNYVPYRVEEAKREIGTVLGWRDYGSKHHESVWTRFFQSYYLPFKYGIDKRRAHLSSLILSEQISRDAAILELEKEDYPEALRKQDETFIAQKLNITPTELQGYVSGVPRSHTDYPNSEGLRHFAANVRKAPRRSIIAF